MALAQGIAGAWTESGAIVTPRSYTGEVRRRFLKNRSGVVALAIIAFMVAVAIAAPLLMLHDPLKGNVSQRLLPIGSSGHAFGTDEQGRDMLDRIIDGGRLSLLTGIMPVLVAAAIATLIGAAVGYVGGTAAAVVMRVMDIGYAFPAILLAIAVASALGPACAVRSSR